VNDVDSFSAQSSRLRRQVIIERLAGFCALAALGYLGSEWNIFLPWLVFVELALAGHPLPGIGKAIGLVLVGAIALPAWCALVLPGMQRFGRGNPSFPRVVAYFLVLLRWVTGWAPRAAPADDYSLKTERQWRVQIGMATLTIILFIAAYSLVQDWQLVMLLAALMPLLGIASFSLVAGARNEVSDGRVDRAALVILCALASFLVVVLARERTNLKAERRTTEGLKATILAHGIEGSGWNTLQRTLRLSLLAHQNAPSWLSAGILRRGVDALPIPLRTLSVKRKDTGRFEGVSEQSLIHVSSSRTGAYVAGATDKAVHVWANGSEGEIGQFDCPLLRELRFNSNESLLAAACEWGTSLRIWDMTVRRERLRVKLSDVRMIRIGPDSRFVAAIEGKVCVHFFALASRAKLATHCAEAPILGVMFARDGRRFGIARRGAGIVELEFIDLRASPTVSSKALPSSWVPISASFAVVTSPAEVTVYDWWSAQPQARVAHEGVKRAFVSTAGDRLITVGKIQKPGEYSSRDEIKVWSLPNVREESSLRVTDFDIEHIGVSENADVIAWRTAFNEASYWHIGDPNPGVVEATGPLALSADGRVLVIGSSKIEEETPSGRLWLIASDDRSTVTHHPDPAVTGVQLDTNFRQAAAFYPDHVLLFDPVSGSKSASIPEGGVIKVYFFPNGRYVATLTGQHELTLWLLARGRAEKIGRNLPRVKQECPLLFAPDGTWVAIDTCNGALQVFATAVPEKLISAHIAPYSLRDLVASSDSRLLATNDEATVTVFEIASRRKILTIPVPQWQGQGHARIAFRPNSHELVVAYTEQPDSAGGALLSAFTNNQRVAVWDVDHGREVAVFTLQRFIEPPDLITFNRDGTHLALANAFSDGPLEIWRLTDPVLQLTIEEDPASVVFSDDSQYLITESGGTLRVWTTDSGDEVDRLPLTDARAGVVFGRYVVTFSKSQGVRRWLIKPRDLIAAGCARLDPQIEDPSASSLSTCPRHGQSSR
jgi:WD40 repeat protein